MIFHDDFIFQDFKDFPWPLNSEYYTATLIVFSFFFFLVYSGPCDLRPPIQPTKYGLKLKVVLKYRDIYTENIQVVLLISGLKMKGIVK